MSIEKVRAYFRQFDKIDAFITMLGDFEILEIARTGITGLGRGIANVTYLD